MIVTIHQPEHFPYLGFFQKMERSDLFVILDSVKYKKNDFQNRNRFINTSGSQEWFGVSVPKKSNSQKICDVLTLDEKLNNWRNKVIKKLEFNFSLSKADLEEIIEVYQHKKLCDINIASIEWCRKKLNINTPMIKSSDLNVKGQKSELLLSICKEVNAKSYLSGPFGKKYLDTELFQENNIEVKFFQPDVPNHYSTLYNVLSKEQY